MWAREEELVEEGVQRPRRRRAHTAWHRRAPPRDDEQDRSPSAWPGRGPGRPPSSVSLPAARHGEGPDGDRGRCRMEPSSVPNFSSATVARSNWPRAVSSPGRREQLRRSFAALLDELLGLGELAQVDEDVGPGEVDVGGQHRARQWPPHRAARIVECEQRGVELALGPPDPGQPAPGEHDDPPPDDRLGRAGGRQLDLGLGGAAELQEHRAQERPGPRPTSAPGAPPASAAATAPAARWSASRRRPCCHRSWATAVRSSIDSSGPVPSRSASGTSGSARSNCSSQRRPAAGACAPGRPTRPGRRWRRRARASPGRR